MSGLEAEADLRPKNQLTVPDAVVRTLGLRTGDRIVFEIDEERPDTVRLRPVRRSYAGILTGVYGSPDEAHEYVRGERASWPA
jgi:bifunctional DNA-binding transcriptional regulator/antitoxin component of YhaV-PrlF toxin-antitoxin module